MRVNWEARAGPRRKKPGWAPARLNPRLALCRERNTAPRVTVSACR